MEEEDGRRWLSRMETRDSRLCGRLEAEEAAPGLWRERREEERPSPSRGDNGKKEKEGRERRKRKKGWNRKTGEVQLYQRDGI